MFFEVILKFKEMSISPLEESVRTVDPLKFKLFMTSAVAVRIVTRAVLLAVAAVI